MIFSRNGIYRLKKRVPKRYQPVESRTFVEVSLKVDDASLAQVKAEAVWEQLVEAWEAKLAGDTTDAEQRFLAAKRLAAARGFRFLPADDVAKLPTEDILSRIDEARKPDGSIGMLEAEAFLGGAKAPPINVRRMLEIVFQISKDTLTHRDRDQTRIWKNSRKRSVENFIKAVGNLPLTDIEPDHVEAYRNWYWSRIESGEVTARTANKEITQLSAMMKQVIKLRRLGIEPPLAGVLFKERKGKTRAAFTRDWIFERILAPGALDGLNTEARCLLLGMINTGYRPGEGANLTANQIRLDGDIPYLHIQHELRDLKTDHSERIIPLAGVSLKAFRECPEGFPRYRNNSGPSALINKYMRKNGLTETPTHTLYGLRHSFEDRLLMVGIDERLRRDFLGHKLDRQRYGEGGSLEFRLAAIQAVAL